MQHFLTISILFTCLKCFVLAKWNAKEYLPEGLSKFNSGCNNRFVSCGQSIDQMKAGQHGFIQSPNYPSNYPSGIECTWDFNAADNTRIHLTIFDLDIFTDKASEDTDSLLVSLTGNSDEVQRFSGDLTRLTPFNLVTEGNKLILRFTTAVPSISHLGHRGFRIAYHVRDISNKKVDKIVDACLNPRIIGPRIPQDNSDLLQATAGFCLNEPEEMQKITRASPTPYLVGLILDEREFCAGALISREHVITTAHCTTGVERVDLVFGTDDLTITDAGVQRRTENAEAVFSHPNFSSRTGLNDISIIKLSQPIKITRFVKKIHLPTWETLGSGFVGLDSEVSGWKETVNGISDVSSNTKMTIEPNAACRGSLDKSLSGMMICLKAPADNCAVNSGSPVSTRCKHPVVEEEEEETLEGPPPEQYPPEWYPSPEQPKPTYWPHRPPKQDHPNTLETPRQKIQGDRTFTANSINLGSDRENWSDSQDNEGEDFDDYIREERPYESGISCDNEFTGNVLLGLKSYGNCKNGFAFTRLIGHLDFINQIVIKNNCTKEI